jgi:cytochrome c oxidase subunit 2
MTKKTAIKVLTIASLLGLACQTSQSVNSAEGAKIIKVSAKRYEFSPSEITLKKGVPVVLQLSTEDRSHGFYAPSLNLRADILPGKVTELKVTPQKTGDFDFFCDIFCGSGHESMLGKITVVE